MSSHTMLKGLCNEILLRDEKTRQDSYLKDDNPKSCLVFSVDGEDLFYSIPQKELLVAVNDCIEATGEVGFRNSSGVTEEGFLDLLSFYLKSMLVQWENGIFVQRNGICIGSCVAPVLSNIFLWKPDVSLEGTLGSEGVKKVFRYVDDYLIFVEANGRADVVDKVSSVFNELGKGLKFTFETPSDGCLQFLDLSLRVSSSHVCWAFSPRSKKALLPYESAHSKIIKRGIAASCLGSALKKSCFHVVEKVSMTK